MPPKKTFAKAKEGSIAKHKLDIVEKNEEE